MWLAKQLSQGKLTGPGKVFLPFVKREVYDQLVKFASSIEEAVSTHAADDSTQTRSEEPAFKSSPSVADSVRAALAADDAVSDDASQQASGSDPEKDNTFDKAERQDIKNAAAVTASAASSPAAASTADPEADSLADTDGTHEELLDAWYWLIRPGQIVLAAEFDDDDEVVGWWEAEVIDVTGEAYMVQFPSDMKAGILPRDEEHIAVLVPKAPPRR